jgi:hypothetical protein
MIWVIVAIGVGLALVVGEEWPPKAIRSKIASNGQLKRRGK